jgi:hypothetical protein
MLMMGLRPSVIALITTFSVATISHADLPDMTKQNIPQPSPLPAAPSGWDVFTPPVTTTPPVSGAPTIAEWTRTGISDDSLILTGDAFSNNTGSNEGSDTQFLVYGQTSGSDSIQSPALIQRLDGLKAAITLPAGLPAWSTYFIWPKNSSGYGTPVGINRTEAWWLGPDQASPGDTVSVYGRNLSHNGGTITSWVYFQPVCATAGQGQWAALVSASPTNPDPVNPYQVQFVVPRTLPDGTPLNTTAPNNTYEVWIHNGHGGDYGWSGPLYLNVTAPFGWDSDAATGTFDPKSAATFNVRDPKYGAKGDGLTDDAPAITAAYAAAQGYRDHGGHPTLYFPSGPAGSTATYMMSKGIGISSNVRFKGAGMNNVILKCRAGTATTPGFGTDDSPIYTGLFCAARGNLKNIEISDMTLDTNKVEFAWWGYALNGNWTTCDNFHLTNVGMKELSSGYVEGCAAFYGVTHLFITDCMFIGGQVFFAGGDQIAISGCTFDNCNNTVSSLGPRGTSEFSVTHCTARDDYDPNNIGIGRLIAANSDWGTQSDYYFGDNTTHLWPPYANNWGEQILCEGGYTQYSGSPTTATANTVTFSGLVLNSATGTTGWTAVIVNGKGLGQHRLITSYDGAKTITVSPAWNVPPDSTSTVLVARAADRWTVYHNDMEGNPSLYETMSTSMSGIQPYGGCYDWIGDSNTFKYLDTGLAIAEIEQTSPIAGIDPCYFNYYANNTIQSCFKGISASSDNPTITSSQNFGIGFLGTVFRHNTVTATIGACESTDAIAASYSHVAPGVAVDMTVFEHNSFTIEPNLFPSTALWQESLKVPEGFDGDLNTHYYTPPLENPVVWAQNAVLYKNTFALDPATPPSGTIGIYFATNTLNPTLLDNTWTGFETTYACRWPGHTTYRVPPAAAGTPPPCPSGVPAFFNSLLVCAVHKTPPNPPAAARGRGGAQSTGSTSSPQAHSTGSGQASFLLR